MSNNYAHHHWKDQYPTSEYVVWGYFYSFLFKIAFYIIKFTFLCYFGNLFIKLMLFYLNKVSFKQKTKKTKQKKQN